MKYVIACVVCIAIFIVCVVIVKKNQLEKRKYYDAAERMVKEEYLEDVLENSANGEYYPVVVPMLYIKLIKPKPVQRYVFNPEKGISIGRNRQENTIWLPNPTVSMKHCSIYLYEGKIYLRDENSANGTLIKKGNKKYMLTNGNVILLENGDVFYINNTIFKVTVFRFHAMKRCR